MKELCDDNISGVAATRNYGRETSMDIRGMSYHVNPNNRCYMKDILK